MSVLPHSVCTEIPNYTTDSSNFGRNIGDVFEAYIQLCPFVHAGIIGAFC